MHPSTLLSNEEGSLSSYDRYYFGPSRLLTKRIRLKSNDGTLDFTITGGNSIQPIQIASVVWASQAYSQGMRPGDQIISVNGISFQNINYTQALQILYSTNELDIIIRTLRVNALDATLYDWYDPTEQRPTSPPPGSYLSIDAQLPYFEKTVTISVEKGKRLGLVIRGGAEYGLGIFISGIDKNSLSDQVGLCIGDQILSVNGIDFRHITHKDAVQLLRNINQMSFHIRQINKLPKPKDNNINKIDKQNIQYNDIYLLKNNFLHEIYDNNDKIKIRNILKEYLEEKIHIDQLIKPLLQILNKQYQQNKNDIIESIKKYIRPNDLDRFDIYILKDDLNTLKLSHQRLIQNSLLTNNMSKSVENLTNKTNERLIRPQSLLFNEQINKSFEKISPIISNNSINTLRKTKSLHNVDQEQQQQQQEYLSLNKSRTNLTIEQTHLIDQFLKDYSSPYPITIHKVRPTLGIAIEGGFQDRIPLPRIVYMQPDGCAYVSSGLRVGHVIIGLNGYSMKGLLHREAALFIASSFKDKNKSSMDLLVVEPLNNEQ